MGFPGRVSPRGRGLNSYSKMIKKVDTNSLNDASYVASAFLQKPGAYQWQRLLELTSERRIPWSQFWRAGSPKLLQMKRVRGLPPRLSAFQRAASGWLAKWPNARQS